MTKLGDQSTGSNRRWLKHHLGNEIPHNGLHWLCRNLSHKAQMQVL